MRGENTGATFEGALEFILQQRGRLAPLTPLPPLRKGEGE
jgi:hypothetical protein